jgi:hypothetical protein
MTKTAISSSGHPAPDGLLRNALRLCFASAASPIKIQPDRNKAR